MAKKRTRTRKKRRRLSPETRLAKRFKTDIRTVFVNSGFEHIPTRHKHIKVGDRTGEMDSVFVYENVLVVVEDTTLATVKIASHLRNKHEFFEHLLEDDDAFFDVLYSTFPEFVEYYDRHDYEWQEYILCFIYCATNTVANHHQDRYGDIITFVDHPQVKYFLSLSRTIHRSARHELLSFLDVDPSQVGIPGPSETRSYEGLLLPSVQSGFPARHKLVSFLVDPEMLLEQAYVLRSDSWRDSECLYQRLLVKNKIMNMRDYLSNVGRVYVNNIIVTLPEDTRLRALGMDRTVRRPGEKIRPITIEIPRRYNSIGIVDGQHRLYSYHEGGDVHERRIAPLRKKQHLLVTGIVYPEGVTEARKQHFEAELFLEINDKQKRVQSDLKQSIKLILEPYSAIAIGKAVVRLLGSDGPLEGRLELHFYDSGKIKTASIVSYGLRHIVGLGAEHSFFKTWPGPGKKALRKHRAKDALERYIRYCSSELNKLISGFKEALPDRMWTEDKKQSRVLTTTTINGLVFCMRRLVENDKRGDVSYYRRKFGRMTVDFRPAHFEYKSSHWKDLGEQLFTDCFA